MNKPNESDCHIHGGTTTTTSAIITAAADSFGGS